jgi:hypothetical protein
MSSTTELTILERLGERFHPDELETNYQGHLYVGVDPTLDRLHEVCGSDWAWNHVVTQMHDVAFITKENKPPKLQYGFWCHGTLEIQIDGMWIRRDGSGADVNVEPDTAAKSAQAYALRKAGNYFNLARYLAKKSERDMIGLQKQYLQSGDIAPLKQMAQILFHQENPGLELTPGNIYEFFELDTPVSDKHWQGALENKGFKF